MSRFTKLKQLKQSEEDFFKIRCKKCLMPKSAGGWNDPEGNTCGYCSPSEKQMTTFPTDMGNDNADMSVEDVKRLIESQKKDPYDCMVSITGGRDSTFLLYYAKEVLGLNPVAFNFHTGFVTDVAQENMVNVTKTLGIDFIQFRADWQFQRKLARGFFINNGEVCSICHQGYFYTVQKVAQWTGLKVILRGLCKKTEGNYLDPNYVNWYSLSDEDFNARVHAFAKAEGITEAELKKHSDYMRLREWTDNEVKKIDIPDMLDYTHKKIMQVLTDLNWKQKKEFFHSDCLFAPILVCCQRYAEGYSKKHLIISNLTMSEIGVEEGKKMLLAEENIGFDDIPELDKFMDLINVDPPTFESAVQRNWKVRASSPINNL
jgi:hypothetical protein